MTQPSGQEKSQPSESGAPPENIPASALAYCELQGDVPQVQLMELPTKKSRPLTQDPDYKCRPSWSPDNNLLAYFANPGDRPNRDAVEVRVWDKSADRSHAVATGQAIDILKARISWDPDSRRVYLPLRAAPMEWACFDAHTGAPGEPIRLPKNSFLTEAHTLAPNAAYLAGAGPEPKTRVMHIATVRRDGNQQSDLMAPFNESDLALGTAIWSRDSQWVAFEMDTIIMIMSSTYRLNFTAKPLIPYELTSRLTYPSFSPDGEWMACTAEKSGEGRMGSGDTVVTTDIWLMRRDGKKNIQITHSGNAYDPAW
jgi:Tol biopolymer transport system component